MFLYLLKFTLWDLGTKLHYFIISFTLGCNNLSQYTLIYDICRSKTKQFLCYVSFRFVNFSKQNKPKRDIKNYKTDWQGTKYTPFKNGICCIWYLISFVTVNISINLFVYLCLKFFYSSSTSHVFNKVFTNYSKTSPKLRTTRKPNLETKRSLDKHTQISCCLKINLLDNWILWAAFLR